MPKGRKPNHFEQRLRRHYGERVSKPRTPAAVPDYDKWVTKIQRDLRHQAIDKVIEIRDWWNLENWQ